MKKCEQTGIDISIIIPLYNAEDTLERCIYSVINQNVKKEIILIDDGSKDTTEIIGRRFENEYPFVKYIRKSNGGVASARNKGIDNAQGKYITFLDQDDWIEKDSYVAVLDEVKKIDADMAVFGYFKNFPDYEIKMVNNGDILNVIKSVEMLIEYAFYRENYRNYAAFVWNKVFKREFLVENGIRFEEGLKRGDDVLFYVSVAVYQPLTIYINQTLYHYVQRSTSVTHTYTKENLDTLGQILIGYEKSIKLLEERRVKTRYINFLKCFYTYHASILYKLSKRMGENQKKNQFRENMKMYYKEYCLQNKGYKDRIEEVQHLIEEI